MELDYQLVMNSIAEIITYCLPLGIIIGLIERLMSMIIKAATGKAGD